MDSDDPVVSDNIFNALPTLSASTREALADELTRYLSAPVERTLNPLLWWVDKQAVYPRLSRMARDYLCIPGKSFSKNHWIHF
jgi:hypothetical protein